MQTDGEMPDWAPACLGPAFAGNGVRQGPAGRESMPVFFWGKALSGLIKSADNEKEAWSILQDSRAIWLVPVLRPYYWQLVRAGKLQIWDELHDALEGVGHLDGIRVAVYSRAKTIQHFLDGFVDASGVFTESEIRGRALDRFKDVLNYHNGPGTPFFV